MPRREVIDDEAAHSRGVVDGDVDEEVVRPAEEEELDDVRMPPHLVRERADALLALTRPEGDPDDRLQTAAQPACR